MIDRQSPGIEIRPIQQMNHAADFAELFFNDVEVPTANIIGEINRGWYVAMSTLTHERSSNLNTAGHFARQLDGALRHAPADLVNDTSAVELVGKLVEEITAYRYMTLRTLTEMARGRTPGAQSRMGKLWWSELQTRIQQFGLELLGDRAELLRDETGTIAYEVQDYWLGRAAHIYAGSNEIQRNIIAERVLGLPKGN
jgi:alkylation response protein AidB-like acyl-CoA dehydrogenase